MSRSWCPPNSTSSSQTVAQRRHRGSRVGEGYLEQRPLRRQRGTELVRRVRDEIALRCERRLEPCQKVVESGAQLVQLVVGTVDGEAPVQVARRDLPRRRRDLTERSEGAAGEHPSERDRKTRQGPPTPTSESTSCWCTSALRCALNRARRNETVDSPPTGTATDGRRCPAEEVGDREDDEPEQEEDPP